MTADPVLAAVDRATAGSSLPAATGTAPGGDAAAGGAAIEPAESGAARARSRWFQIGLSVVASGSIATLGVAYLQTEQAQQTQQVDQAFERQQALAGIECDDAYRDAVDDITADTRDRPDYRGSVEFRDGLWKYLTRDEQAACPTWKDDVLAELDQLSPQPQP